MLSAEPLIVARLEAKLAALNLPALRVLTAPDLAEVAEEQQTVPAVHVVYGGHAISQDQGEGAVVELQQTWHTVVVVRNVRGIRSGEAAREEAGQILDAVFRALTGWRPGAEFRRLRPANAPRAGYSKGYGYYPLSWTLKMQMRGEA
jgi:hypothetical protein